MGFELAFACFVVVGAFAHDEYRRGTLTRLEEEYDQMFKLLNEQKERLDEREELLAQREAEYERKITMRAAPTPSSAKRREETSPYASAEGMGAGDSAEIDTQIEMVQNP